MDKLIRKINTSPKPKLKYSPSRSSSRVFGVPLKLLLDSQSSSCSSTGHIPAIVTNLCQCLLKHGTEVEGIFRINGSARLIELFKRDLEFSPSSDLRPTENVEIYALAGVLKLFLRELPDGVVPEEYTLKLIKAIGSDGEDTLECLQRLQELIPLLPRENRRLLHYLCRFLNKIAANEAFNKMSCQGLGILFGPCIFRFDVRSQGLRNQGLVNQAMIVLIEYCDTIFRPDHMDETFALGDDLVDSWRSATSGLGSDSFDLKMRSMTCSSSSSSVNRSFYSTLFSGRSNEHLTTEGTDLLLPGVDPPTLLSSSEYRTVKPLHSVAWPTRSTRLLSSRSELKRDATSVTFESALSSANSTTQATSYPHLASDELRFGFNHQRATTTISSSSSSSHADSVANLNAQPSSFDSPKFQHSETWVSQSEPGNNLPNTFHSSDSSNQLALDLAHLLTSFGSSDCLLDFPVRTKPNEHSASGHNHALPPQTPQFIFPYRESNGLHTCVSRGAEGAKGKEQTTKKKPAGSGFPLHQPTHKPPPPVLIVSRPSTCGDHEPLVPGEQPFHTTTTICGSDYERALYELASTLPNSTHATAATTGVRTITITGKAHDDPSEGDLLGQDLRSLAPDSCFSGRLGTDTTATTTTTTSTINAAANSTAVAPLTHWNQAINACLDAHVFAAGPTKDRVEKSLQRGKSLPNLHSTPAATSARTHLQSRSRCLKSARTSRSLFGSTSSFPLLLRAPQLRHRRSSTESRTAVSESPPVSKRQPHISAPDSPYAARPPKAKLTTSRSTESLSTINAQPKSLSTSEVGLSRRPVSAPSIDLPSPSTTRERNLSEVSPRRKHQPRISRKASAVGFNRREHTRVSQYPDKLKNQDESCGSVNVSTSAPPTLTSTPLLDSTPSPMPRSLLRPSASCSELPRSCDRKQGTSDTHRRRRRHVTSARPDGGGAGGEPVLRKSVPLVRSYSFHYLPPRIKGPHLFVIPKAISLNCIRGSIRRRLRRSTKSSQRSRNAKPSRSEEPSTAVGQQVAIERQIHDALNDVTVSRERETASALDSTRPNSIGEGATTAASLQAFCELLTAVLEEQRRCCGRPNVLSAMNSEQIFQEKVDLQKGLLYFERLHGRPNDPESKRIMKPLYERYRQVKRLLRASDLAHATEQNHTPVTGCLEALETSFQLTPHSTNCVSPNIVPNGSQVDSKLTMPVASPALVSRVGSALVQETLSPLSVRTKQLMSCPCEREHSHNLDSRLFDWNESSLLDSPPVESNSRLSAVPRSDTLVEQRSAPWKPLTTGYSGPQGEYVVSPHRIAAAHRTNFNHEELLGEWRHILGKKRALQHELREFESRIEQVKGRPPDKTDRVSMRDKYHEYRSLKRTLETLALRLNMEPNLSVVYDSEPSDQHVRRVPRNAEPDDVSTHAYSPIRTP